MIFIVAVFLVGVGFVVWIYWPQLIGAGWSPTPMDKVRKMLEMAQVGKEDIVYDLGCGDGRIVAVAAGEFGARAVGIEADPVRFLISFLRVKLGRTKNRAKIIWGNFYSCSLSEATVVTVFLSPEANERLKEKLQRELSPGTRIVSYLWVFEGWKAIKADYLSHLYLYRI